MGHQRDMKKPVKSRIPVNLISGPLGVGKTTTVNHLLRNRPAGERWAVLVNEYGLIGLDAALMEPETKAGTPVGVDIREVAGGCICCSAGLMFEVSLVLLLQRRPDRLLIEPTGLAALSGILDTLDRPGIRESVDVQSILCLLDPKSFREDMLREHVQDQIEAADIIIASQPDLASPQQLDAFQEWAHSLFPAKRWIGPIEQGRIPIEHLALVADRKGSISRGGHAHGTDHHHHHQSTDANASHDADLEKSDLVCDASNPIIQRAHHSLDISTLGWVCWGELVFDAKAMSCWLAEISRQPGAIRTKAVIRTNEGWCAFNFTNDVQEVRPSGYRRDSRLEIIFEGDGRSDISNLDKKLRQNVVNNDIMHQSSTLSNVPNIAEMKPARG